MRLLAALAAMVIAAAMLAGCGTSGPSQADLTKARAEGAAAERKKQTDAAERKKQAALAARVNALEKKLAKEQAAAKKKSKPAAAGSSSGVLASATPCGGNIYAGSNTTCPFATNVANAWYGAGGGSVTVEAWSPVTQRYYLMTCTAGVPTNCRGGNNAVVYIR